MAKLPRRRTAPADWTGRLRAERHWFVLLGTWWLALGAVAVLAPVLFRPDPSLLLGVVLTAGGVSLLCHTFRGGYWNAFILEAAGAMPGFVTGVLLLVLRPDGLAEIGYLLAAYLGAEGVARLIVAWHYRHAAHTAWLWFTVVLAFALAACAWWRFPAAAPWVFGLIAGLHLGMNGWGWATLAHRARS